MQRFSKFSNGITKYGSVVVKTVANVALSNPFSVYCNNLVDVTTQCATLNNGTCHNMLHKNWCDTVSEEMMSNINVLKEMIDIRDGLKECECLNLEEIQCIIDEICLN